MKAHLEFYDKEDRPWPSLRLTSAAIVGHTTATSTRLWARVHAEGDYALVITRSEINTLRQPALRPDGRVELIWDKKAEPLETVVAMQRRFRYATDLTEVFEVSGLEPATRYFYAVFAVAERPERWEVGRDEPLRFRTPAAKQEAVSFGLFSCHMPFVGRTVRNMGMWESFGQLLRDCGADFVMGAGDQVYTDGDSQLSIWKWLKKNKEAVRKLGQREQLEVMVSWYRDIYRGYWGDLALRRVLRNFPTYMIWDDHEIMDGWGSYTHKELSNTLDTIWEWENKRVNLTLAHRMFEAAQQVYGEYQHSHNPPTPAGCWDYSFTWGHLAFYVLDMRGHRDYTRPSHKILGREQGRRFQEWMQGPEAKGAAAVFIVSPVPVVHLTNFITNTLDLPALGLADDLRDEWEHKSNYSERNMVLDAVFDFSHTTRTPVSFLSGDVHIGAAFKLSRKGRGGARVFQLTSSGITYAKSPGKLLRLVVRDRGELSGLPKAKQTTLERLHVFEDNNFGFVHSRLDAHGAVELAWDLYGSTGRPEEVVRLKRLRLTP